MKHQGITMRICLMNKLALLPAIALTFYAVCCTARADSIYPHSTWKDYSKNYLAGNWSESKLGEADKLADSIGTDAYVLVHKGEIIHSYGDVAKPMNLASIRKSVLSLLYGIHVNSGQIDLNQTLENLEINDKGGLTVKERTATVKQLLQARSGVYHAAAYETPEAKANRPSRESHDPGTFWYYNNWDFNALGTIFQKRTGKTVFEALSEEIAIPLQLEDFLASRDTVFRLENVSDHPAYLMYMSTRDLARIGLLVSRNGVWNGQQVIPGEWMRESTIAYSQTAEGWNGYGYLWWVPLAAFPNWRPKTNSLVLGTGDGGQFLLVDRARDIVLVHRVDNDRPWYKKHRVNIAQFAVFAEKVISAAPGNE